MHLRVLSFNFAVAVMVMVMLAASSHSASASVTPCVPGSGRGTVGNVSASTPCDPCDPGYRSAGGGEMSIDFWESDPPQSQIPSQSRWVKVDGGRAIRSGSVLPSGYEVDIDLVGSGFIAVDVRHVLRPGASLSIVDVTSSVGKTLTGISLGPKRVFINGGTGLMASGVHRLRFTVSTTSPHVDPNANVDVAYLHSIVYSGALDACQPCPPGTFASASGSSVCTPCVDGSWSNSVARISVCGLCDTAIQFTPADAATACSALPQCSSRDLALRLGPCTPSTPTPLPGGQLYTQTVVQEPAGAAPAPCLSGSALPTPQALPDQQCAACPGSTALDPASGFCAQCGIGTYRRDGDTTQTAPCNQCSTGSVPRRRLVFNRFDGPWTGRESEGWSVGCSGRCKTGRENEAWERVGTALRTSAWHGQDDAFLHVSLGVNHTHTAREPPALEFTYSVVDSGLLYFIVNGVVSAVFDPSAGGGGGGKNVSGRYSYVYDIEADLPLSDPATFTYTWLYKVDQGQGVAEVSGIVAVNTASGGGESCRNCDRGYYAPTAGLEDCVPCEAGRYSGSVPEFGQMVCDTCDPNTFSYKPGMAECLKCGRGSTGNMLKGSTDCDWGACRFRLHAVQPETLWDLSPLPRVTVGKYSISVCSRASLSSSSSAGGGSDLSFLSKSLIYQYGSSSVSFGRVLDVAPDAAGAELTASFMYGDPCGSDQSKSAPASYHTAEIDLICGVGAGVGTPKHVSTAQAPGAPAGCLIAKFMWVSHHACPLCLDGDIVKAPGQCVNGMQKQTIALLRPCFTTAPTVQSVPCTPMPMPASDSWMSWAVGLLAGGGGALLMGAVAFLLVRNRRLTAQYQRLLSSAAEAGGSGNGSASEEPEAEVDVELRVV